MNKFSLVLLAVFLPIATSYGDTPDKTFLKQVYANGGKTLYCQEAFQADDRVSLEHIYDERRLAQHFGCRTSRLCQSNRQFVEVSRDRHSLFPVTRHAELDRRRTLLGDLPATTATDPECGYKQAFQVFEPPTSAKGDVARAMLYLYDRYDIPMLGTLEMYQRWHRDDPVDDEERRRNNVIEQIQGNRNPFIDEPDRAESLQGSSPLNMQFP
ncbi:endonuclease [Alcanivorax sp.]|jgi:deoxyribonuclease-1|uniref:endonuclease n=1 Tax=Alcanivorax sp. TaxID=1872427 RepID=UPI00198CEFC3|nr:endonuclease [Alcanivorax sp.]MBD3644950.1 endonuclease [Alcanivorax sp.]